MSSSDTNFKQNYQSHLKHLKLKGLQPKTIEAYARAIRRIGAYFDTHIDDLSEQQLTDYFTDLLESHSWSAVKIDLYGLKFYYTHVLHKPWENIDLIKPPKTQRLTTLLSPCKTAKADLEALFLQRWHVELDLRNIKTTLGMDALSCKSPEMCEKELWVYLLAYNLIRLLMTEAALQAGVRPRQLSFKHTLQIWVAWSQRQFLSGAKEDTATLFLLIAQIRVGERPGRVEPRAVKRRPKPYPLLNKSREKARQNIRKHGHAKKLGLN